jgi:hypothetical protein
MSKWDKLNKEFDSVLDNLTKEDWIKWDQNRKEIKKSKREELLSQSLFCEQSFVLDEKECSPPDKYEFDKYFEITQSPINSGIFFA